MQLLTPVPPPCVSLSLPCSFSVDGADPVADCTPLAIGTHTIKMVGTDDYPLPTRSTCTGTITVALPAPVCGNGVVEAGEVCDGSSDCAADCKSVIKPNQPPTLSCPPSLSLPSGPSGATTDYCALIKEAVTATDPDAQAGDAPLAVTVLPGCDTPLAFGTHDVKVVVTDAQGASSACSVAVVVTATCGNSIVEGSGEVCDDGPAGSDACSDDCKNRAPHALCKDEVEVAVDAAECTFNMADLEAAVDAGSYDDDLAQTLAKRTRVLGLDATQDAAPARVVDVELQVTDSYSPAPLSASCKSKVKAVDRTAPTVSGTAASQCVWPPAAAGCACFDAQEVLAGLSISDNCQPALDLTATFVDDCVDVVETKAAGGASTMVTRTGSSAACRVRANGAKLCVSASKDANADPAATSMGGRRSLAQAAKATVSRIYTVSVRVSDKSGNSVTVPNVRIVVPHDATGGVAGCRKPNKALCAA